MGALTKAIASSREDFRKGRQGPRCPFEVLFEHLDEEDRKSVEDLFADARITGSRIGDFLSTQGRETLAEAEAMKLGPERTKLEDLSSFLGRCKANAVRNHRNERCGCYQRR